jgi:hypothetical protein
MPRDDEAERYRKAAEAALDQLHWCADYLRRIRKHSLADRVARNCSIIRGRLVEPADRQSQ